MRFRNRWNFAVLGFAGGSVLAAALAGWPQYAPSNNGPLIQNLPNTRMGTGGGIEGDPAFEGRRLRALNLDRHKSMISDTDKLVKLARQLDQEIASNPSTELTSEQLHKVAEIEKLAHNVKTKMAQSFDTGPRFIQMPVPSNDPYRQ